MSKQKEGSLQERIQKLIISKGGYCQKNWGGMMTEPGVPDIFACYKGQFLAIEVKVDNNTPSRQQGIQCRNIWRAGGIAIAVWDIIEVNTILSQIDRWYEVVCEDGTIQKGVETFITFNGIDDGRGW